MNEQQIEQRLANLETTHARNLNAAIARTFADDLIGAQILAILALMQKTPESFLQAAKNDVLDRARQIDNGTVPKELIDQVSARIDSTFLSASKLVQSAG